jgi:hypothetical protein
MRRSVTEFRRRLSGGTVPLMAALPSMRHRSTRASVAALIVQLLAWVATGSPPCPGDAAALRDTATAYRSRVRSRAPLPGVE